MRNPLYFPNAEQFRRDREAKARSRRALGRHMFATSTPQLAETPHVQAATVLCAACGVTICAGSPGVPAVQSVCAKCRIA